MAHFKCAIAEQQGIPIILAQMLQWQTLLESGQTGLPARRPLAFPLLLLMIPNGVLTLQPCYKASPTTKSLSLQQSLPL